MSFAPRPRRSPRGLPLRAVAPNAVTALALCSGLSGIRFAIDEKWWIAVAMVMVAGVLDGLDGRVARMLHGESRFGAELDSLSDAISFGVSPALILFLWSTRELPRFGWIAALLLAVFCALRLARFNAAIDAGDQPHKSAGFLTGVPAPAGASLALLPMFAWLATDEQIGWLRSPYLVAPWMVLVAGLMVSNLATWSWTSVRLRRNVRFRGDPAGRRGRSRSGLCPMAYGHRAVPGLSARDAVQRLELRAGQAASRKPDSCRPRRLPPSA